MKKRIRFVLIALAASIMLNCPVFAEKYPPPNEPANIELPVIVEK